MCVDGAGCVQVCPPGLRLGKPHPQSPFTQTACGVGVVGGEGLTGSGRREGAQRGLGIMAL